MLLVHSKKTLVVLATLLALIIPAFSQTVIIDDFETDGGDCGFLYEFVDIQEEGTFEADRRVMFAPSPGEQCTIAVDGIGAFVGYHFYEPAIQAMIYEYDTPIDLSGGRINLDVLDFGWASPEPPLTVFYVLVDNQGNDIFFDAPLLPDGTAPFDLNDATGVDVSNITLIALFAEWYETEYFAFVVFDDFRWEVLDSDGDGVPDASDACPDSDLSPTLIINGIDTGIENTVDENGCSLADLSTDALTTGGQSALVALANQWKKDGLITGKEFGAIVSAAASGNGNGGNGNGNGNGNGG